ERTVVVRVIFGPQTRPAVVAAARGHCRLVEPIDSRAIRARDRDVDRGARPLGDPEVGLALRAESGDVAELHHERVAERRERVLEELHAARVIRHAQPDVVDHRVFLLAGGYATSRVGKRLRLPTARERVDGRPYPLICLRSRSTERATALS